MGFEDYIPPFADSSGSNILLGINYASSGAGILNETGQIFVCTNISWYKQWLTNIRSI